MSTAKLNSSRRPIPLKQHDRQHLYRSTKPQVTKTQSTKLAKNLFTLETATVATDVKEFDSYEDRLFLLKGTLKNLTCDSVSFENEQYFILKVTNSVASKNQDLFSIAADLLQHIRSTSEIQCPVPQPSIFGTKNVLCKFGETGNVSGEIDVLYSKYDGKEIKDGMEAVSIEEDVCAVQLMSFVPGKILCEATVEWGNDLLVDFGAKIAYLHIILQEYSKTNAWVSEVQLQQPNHQLTLMKTHNTLQLYSYALNNKQQQIQVEEIARRYKTEVQEKIHSTSFELQLIHGDLTGRNAIVGTNSLGQIEIKGFIDFNDMQYSYRVLDVGVALGSLMVEAWKRNLDVIQACNQVIKGYQSVFPLTDFEVDKLFIVAQARICQSLVLGAYWNEIAPDNSYVASTEKGSWQVLERLRLLSECKILNQWKALEFPSGD